ncbi:transcription factor AP-2-beta-like [Panulirus ornatus]|uniref:transcription factor AP-2-beta-like n=1 Tax=Panulirus ornatus TaxID=150431 RepID=UPI003A87A8C1
MAGEVEIIEEILNSSSSANEEEIVHIIQSSDEDTRAAAIGDTSITSGEAGEASYHENKELVFWVPALLMVGREQQRITVTQNELCRRVEQPECLSQTMLLSLLRLSKEKGRELKQTLAKNGIKKLTSKSAVISCFTKLTETEAAQLAEDFFYLASRNLRLKEINREIIASRGGWDQFETQANITKELLQDILKEIEARDIKLSLMTHGFSPLIIRAVIDILIEIITFRET